MYDEEYGAEFYELLAELDITERRVIVREAREFQTEQQKILDAYNEWYQTVGFLAEKQKKEKGQ